MEAPQAGGKARIDTACWTLNDQIPWFKPWVTPQEYPLGESLLR